ncbi:MAG: FkbM family methyltransferase [Opitutae bacterium]|nr:FkbM family methyltransferase [Opitutae bacterium]
MMSTLLRRWVRGVRFIGKVVTGREVWMRSRVSAVTEFHGSEYGGWAILADSLDASSTVLSFGIGDDCTFDLALIAKYGCTVHGFDPTPKSIAWVESNIHDPRFVFHPWALAGHSGTLELYLPVHPDHVSASLRPGTHVSAGRVQVPCFDPRMLMQRLGVAEIDVLKMDIEGAEYEVIDRLVTDGELRKVRQLLIEFHHWLPAFGAAATRRALHQLRQAGFVPCWISPSGHEVLFVPRP